jgi:hypothetical protein
MWGKVWVSEGFRTADGVDGRRLGVVEEDGREWRGGATRRGGGLLGGEGVGNGLLELRKCDMGYPGAVGCIGEMDRQVRSETFG